MQVSVEDGRAVKVAGDPDHPITVGFLCGKVSNYPERVYDLGQGPAPHADGGFGTESGRMALRAAYVPAAEVADSALAERFPLALITPKTHLFLNSTFANQQRQHAAQPRPEVVVSPEDALARGIEDGTRVRIWNDRGEFSCPARVSDDARARPPSTKTGSSWSGPTRPSRSEAPRSLPGGLRLTRPRPPPRGPWPPDGVVRRW